MNKSATFRIGRLLSGSCILQRLHNSLRKQSQVRYKLIRHVRKLLYRFAATVMADDNGNTGLGKIDPLHFLRVKRPNAADSQRVQRGPELPHVINH